MRGITEERLKVLLLEGRTAVEIIKECKELNTWQPIDENIPKDRPILIYSHKSRTKHIAEWNDEIDCFLDCEGIELPCITRWQELPEDPK